MLLFRRILSDTLRLVQTLALYTAVNGNCFPHWIAGGAVLILLWVLKLTFYTAVGVGMGLYTAACCVRGPVSCYLGEQLYILLVGAPPLYLCPKYL